MCETRQAESTHGRADPQCRVQIGYVQPHLPHPPREYDRIDALARIHVKSWQAAYRGQIPDAVLDALDERQRATMWRELMEAAAHVVHVAVHEGNVIAFCTLGRSRDAGSSDDTGEIGAIYVEPQHWRLGAGSALMGEALRSAQALGYRVVSLWVLASNTAGRSFYERVGFAADGESKLETRRGYSLFEVRYRCTLRDIKHDAT